MKPSLPSTLFLGRNLIELEEVSSTNDFAQSMLNGKHLMPPEGTVVVAYHQYSGRGQRGELWASEYGKNLLLSIILFPGFLPAQDQFLLNQAISLGIYDFAMSYLHEQVLIKWPNDLYYKNKKLGGVLIENTLRSSNIQHSVIGIGININQYLFSDQIKNPTSFRRITKQSYDLNECRETLFSCLEARYLQLKAGRFELLNKEYTAAMYLFGKQHFFENRDGIFRGKISGMNKEGKLEITLKKGEKKYFGIKEIRFL